MRLHTAQPALSRQIIDLEKELGDQAFRSRRAPAASHRRGRAHFLGNCRRLLGYASSLSDLAQELQRGDSGVLESHRLAADDRQCVFYIPSSLRKDLSQCAGAVNRGHRRRRSWRWWNEAKPILAVWRMRRFRQALNTSEAVCSCLLRFRLSITLRSSLDRAARSISAAWRHIHCSCWIPASCFGRHSMRRAFSPASRQMFCSRAALRTRCSHWLNRGTGLRSSRQTYCFIATA